MMSSAQGIRNNITCLRLMGYSVKRIAELCGLPAVWVRATLVSRGLADGVTQC